MMGERRLGQEALFYEFSLERHVPENHLLRHPVRRDASWHGLHHQDEAPSPVTFAVDKT